ADNYIGDYAVTVEADGAAQANAGQDGDGPVVGDEGDSADGLTATFSVVADDDAPGGGDDGSDDDSGNGDNGSGDDGSG
ncbi:hypothetical protein DR093_03255, partial [Mycoplasma flocculare]